MDVQFLHHMANTQDGIYLKVKRQKQTPITPHLKASVFVAEHTLAKQHKKMLKLRAFTLFLAYSETGLYQSSLVR